MTSPGNGRVREPWDFAAFLRHYDELARAHTGWVYDASSPDAEKLKGWWYESTTLFDSLQDFARIRFQLDQQL
jgi:hypothetical protein